MSDITLTVFTPTYNRAHLLVSLYDSLKAQTDKDFVWLIVDDGSTDDTKKIVEYFIKENVISINYIFQSNQGKYIAHNTAVRLCETELFVCVDSDDTLECFAIERTKSIWGDIKSDKKICGIASPKKMIGEEKFVNAPKTGTLLELYNKKHFNGEAMLVYRSDILKEFMFPEINGEKFMCEGYIYIQIDHHYKLYFDNFFMYNAEYQEDGISLNAQRIRMKNPMATLIMFKTDAKYHTFFIKAVKAYASYLAWKDVFELREISEFPEPRWSVKFIGRLLKWHYKSLFRKL